MKKTAEEKNKKLVLEGFDTLFNKRDYAAAEGFGRHVTSNTALTLRVGIWKVIAIAPVNGLSGDYRP
jgi:hypothetical protein